MTRKPGNPSGKSRTPRQTQRERDQPYATEKEAYRFDKLKPPTDPAVRQAHGKPSGGTTRAPDQGRPGRRTDGSAR